MANTFTNKAHWALILGGSSGLGLASARKLAAEARTRGVADASYAVIADIARQVRAARITVAGLALRYCSSKLVLM